MPEFSTAEITVDDGVIMRARLYDGGGDDGGNKTPIICIHGLTRNARDFEEVAPRVAAQGRNVVAVSLRGRGASDRDPFYLRYFPTIYRDDIITALDKLEIEKAVFIGTSLGGITTMLVSEKAPARVAGAILNDVGPDLAPEGIARIAGYVGAAKGNAATLEEAAEQCQATNSVAFPNASSADWIAFARRAYRQLPDGTWTPDYDPQIARALIEAGPTPDLWPAFESLRSTPTLLIRGALSDLLTPPIVDAMRARDDGFDYCEVANVGHAPMLTEPEAVTAIDQFLAGID